MKREKIGKLAAMGTMCVLSLILAVVCHICYPGVMRSECVLFVGFTVIAGIGFYLIWQDREPVQREQNRPALCVMVLVAGVLVIWLIVKQALLAPRMLNWLWIAVLIACAVQLLVPRLGRGAALHILICVALFGATGLYFGIVQPASVGRAERQAAQAGYTDVAFRKWQDVYASEIVEDPAEQAQLMRQGDDALGYYEVGAQRDGESYLVYVSVVSGEVRGAQAMKGASPPPEAAD